MIKKILITFLIFAVCLFLSACGGGGGSVIYKPEPAPVPPAPPVNLGASISGYFSYGETAAGAAPLRAAAGDLVNNATVELRKKSDYNTILSTVLTVNGKFLFSKLEPAEYIITGRVIDGPAVLKNEFGVKIEANKYEYNIGSAPIELVKTGDITLTFKTAAGEPVAGALITVDGSQNGYSGADGSIVFGEITRGAHEIKASKPGYFDGADVISVTGGAQAAVITMRASEQSLAKPEVDGLYFGAAKAAEAEVIEGETLEISASATNPNGGTLVFNWSSDSGKFITQNEYTVMGPVTASLAVWRAPLIGWAPGQTYAYRCVSVSISDQKGFIINRAGRVKVINKNAGRFKIISSPSAVLLQLNRQFVYRLELSPQGGYKFELLDAPAGMSVTADGLLSFTPASYGVYNAVIKVSSIASGYFQTQKFTLTAADSIAELGGAPFSKTVLKPGSGLSTIVKNFKTTEHLTAISYNKNASYNSFELSTYNLAAAAPFKSATGVSSPALSTPAMAPDALENLSAESMAAIRMDFARRENERLTARLKTSGCGAPRTPAAGAEKQAASGDIKDFYSLNSLAWPPRESDWTRVSARLRAIGSRCYIYEDTSIPYPYLAITEGEITRFKNSFDNEIYPLITGAFGDEPNPGIDNDSRIYLLFTHNVNKQSAAGYFDSTNQLAQAKLDSSSEYNKNSSGYKYYSNEKEIFYMAVPKSSFKGETYQTNTLGVIAHEFQHMINWNHHSSNNPDMLEESWLNEGLSQLAQDIAGYGYQYGTLSFVMEPFLRYPESYSLTKFQFGLGYYGNAYLFVRYLADRGANPMNLVKNAKIGRANVEDEIKRIGAAESFDDFFEEFAAALYLSNRGITNDAKFNFKSINLRATQKDGTVLNGLKLNSSIYIPGAYKGLSLSEYSISALKCQTHSEADYKFNISDKTGGGIGTVVLRINGQ